MSDSPRDATPLDSQPQPTPPSTFKLLIKNPTDRPGASPFTINILTKSTVRNLKELLSRSYPGSPPVASQRLIYAGKLLHDSLILDSFITSNDPPTQHTVHLVVSSFLRAVSPSASAAPPSSASTQPSSNARSQPQAPDPAHDSALPHPQPYPTPGHPQHFATMLNNPYIPFQQYQPGTDPQRLYYPSVPGIPPHDPAAYPLPYPPQYPSYPPPPSDDPANAQQRNNTPASSQMPFANVDPSAYANHLQFMERIIADSLVVQQSIAQQAAASATAQGRATGATVHQMARAAATAAATATMHARLHAQAMANRNAVMRAEMENNQAAQERQDQGPIQGPGIGFGIQFGRANEAMDGVHQHQHQHHNQAMGEGGPRVRRFVFQFEINWVLISKLILIVYLLGQEGSPRRVYTLMALALAIYLWQTNRLGFLRRVAGAALPNPAQLFESLFPQENPSSEDNAGPSDAEQRADLPRPRAANRFGRAAVILCFVYSFFYGFVSSLLPAWRPQPLPRLDELLNPHPNENEDQQGREAAEADGGQDNQHEHAD